MAAAKKDTASSASHYATLKDTAASGGIPVATTTALMVPKADGGIDRAHGESIASVAHAVESIVLANFAQSEFDFMCIKILGPEGGTTTQTAQVSNEIRAMCIEHVKESFKRTSELANSLALGNFLIAEVQSAEAEIGERADELFESFWKKVSTDGKTAAPQMVSSLKKKFSWWPSCFDSGLDRATYRTCFNQLTAPKQRRLAR